MYHGHQYTKSITNKSLIGAVSLIVALKCTTIAFLAPQPSSSPHFLSKKSFCLIRWNDGFTHSASMKTTLSMVAKSGGRLIVSTEQFDQEVLFRGILESNRNDESGDDNEFILPILVLFSAPWCGPCRLTSPVVKDVMKQYQSKIEVVEISTDDLPEVASKAGVLSIPTILIYHRGEVMDTIVGCVAKNVLARAVDKVLEDLGMLGGED